MNNFSIVWSVLVISSCAFGSLSLIFGSLALKRRVYEFKLYEKERLRKLKEFERKRTKELDEREHQLNLDERWIEQRERKLESKLEKMNLVI